MDQAERERMYRPLCFDKMEGLVREMQDSETGVPVRSQKLFLTSIPSAFMGYDLIEWLMERLNIEESVEAVHIANQLCNYGYFFPVSDSKNLIVKDDGSLYRFQSPYYWPWQHKTNKTQERVEYAIYLSKRTLRNKQRHGLEEYEIEALASLKNNLAGKWELITMQAEEQVRLAKERKKGDKIVSDSQERAYWRVCKPPPGYTSSLESVPASNEGKEQRQKRRQEDLKREREFLQKSLSRTRVKFSVALENLFQHAETFLEYDAFFTPPQPSNPWLSDDITFWQINSPLVEIPTEKRVRRWALSMEEIMNDPKGIQEFTNYLHSEYSHENIRFCMEVNDLRRSGQSQIQKKVQAIYEEFLAPGAPCEINIDGKTMEKVQQELKNPSRFAFDCAAEHIYTLLLKKDTYPRFLRSDFYKNLLANAVQPSQRRRFFGFGGAAKKKSSTSAVPNTTLLQQQQVQQQQQQPQHSQAVPAVSRRRGSDRSLTGSAHELAICGVAGPSRVPLSHSQSNLSDTPYRDPPGGSSDEAEGRRPEKDDCCPWDIRGSPQPSGSFEEDRRRKLGVAGSSMLSEDAWEGEGLKHTLEARPSRKNSSQLDSGSSSSELSLAIVDVSERLRRSCVTQQASIAAVEDSRVRRLSTASGGRVESRRASVAAPRASADLRLSPERPSSSAGLEPRRTPESTRPSVSSAEDVPIESPEGPAPAKTDPQPDSLRTLTKNVGRKRCSLIATAVAPLISVSSVAEDVLCAEEVKDCSSDVEAPVAPEASCEESSPDGVAAPVVTESMPDGAAAPVVTESMPDGAAAIPAAAPVVTESTGDGHRKAASTGKTKDVVCPWEDEENCKVDAPFVKTYATLGYL